MQGPLYHWPLGHASGRQAGMAITQANVETCGVAWRCERCRNQLGLALDDGELLILASHAVMVNSTDDAIYVMCHCGWHNIWQRCRSASRRN